MNQSKPKPVLVRRYASVERVQLAAISLLTQFVTTGLINGVDKARLVRDLDKISAVLTEWSGVTLSEIPRPKWKRDPVWNRPTYGKYSIVSVGDDSGGAARAVGVPPRGRTPITPYEKSLGLSRAKALYPKVSECKERIEREWFREYVLTPL
jgi:hypothetical protein